MYGQHPTPNPVIRELSAMQQYHEGGKDCWCNTQVVSRELSCRVLVVLCSSAIKAVGDLYCSGTLGYPLQHTKPTWQGGFLLISVSWPHSLTAANWPTAGGETER